MQISSCRDCFHASREVPNPAAGVAAPHACRDFGLRVAVLNGRAHFDALLVHPAALVIMLRPFTFLNCHRF